MLWFWVIVLVVLIGAVAVVASGRGDAMAEVYEDRADVALPVGRHLTADDLRAVQFNTGVRGYRMDEVDALLVRLQGELMERESERDRQRRDRSQPAEPILADEPAAEPESAPETAPGTAPETAEPAPQSAPEAAPEAAPVEASTVSSDREH